MCAKCKVAAGWCVKCKVAAGWCVLSVRWLQVGVC